MDTLLQECPNSLNRFMFDHASVSFSPNRNRFDGYKLNDTMSDPNPSFNSSNPEPPNDSASPSSSSSSSSESYGPSNNVTLKFISDVLLEEDLEGKTCMLQDCLALQAAEKSFYDVLGQEYPHSSNQIRSCFDQNFESPGNGFTWRSGVDSSKSYPPGNNLVEKSDWVFDQSDLDFYQAQASPVLPLERTLLGPDLHSPVHPFEVLSKGGGDADSFLSGNDYLMASSASNSSNPPDKDDGEHSPNSSRGRKNHQREDSDGLEEERSKKQSALSPADSDLSELLDEVLLCSVGQNESTSCSLLGNSQNGAAGNEQRKGSNGRTARGKKRGKKGEVVDSSSLLIQCAQAVAIGDQRTASELLQQIRQHSSPHGDANQRLAHYFADALDTRLAGTATPAFTLFVSPRTSAADILKAYQVYVRACPFKRMSNFFANRTILKLEKKATRLHIIDFGILYGFQWPCLIQRLSERPGGPPKLRITGIELPQPGFRPAERVEETGRRLERYCERFKVPFEYIAIAQKWETIRYEDLKIDKDEKVVVNCLYRLRNLPDDTIVENSARDAVLKLINEIRPDMFIHGVVNGNFNAPFFVTRFREALYHFSSLFDMFEATVSRKDEHRMLFEKEQYGRDITNVIACEGKARVERPETYKQWQSRNLRAGFTQLPLDKELFKDVRSVVKSEYDKDFVVDADGQWVLQGWKGRIIYALSIWKPVQE
ncbi:SCARECROW-LIKE PROTEIN 30 [Salix koriyanagi]|uniref:SCARECROW-LIKE PROTEIN 30 n=3 Tax=Salix koriyanagi TaxID=2511006 RepID=A0A9Q0YZI1_9ROSI|nr:SCARECROW-LIKE PROTEIN 30 [Salix koriyanagi]